MDQPRLAITIVGSENLQGDVELSDLRKLCDNLTNCLRRVETKLSDSPTRRLRYRIVDLNRGSACLTLEPIPPRDRRNIGPDVFELFSTTIDGLQIGGLVDPRFNQEDFQAFRNLASPINQKVREIHIGNTKITSRFIANIDELMETVVPSEGSVKGRLERLNIHNKYEFVIYPPIRGYSVKCVFTDDHYEKIHKGIRKNVTVYGTLHLRPGRPFPEWVKVRSVEIHPHDDELPKLGDLRGAWKSSNGELSALDFIQGTRDE